MRRPAGPSSAREADEALPGSGPLLFASSPVLAFSLATLSSLTPPAVSNRSLIFRSFVDGMASLVATTDIRSPKVRELREVSDQASICWWHPTPNTQFRIKGAVRVIGPDEAGWDEKRKETWDKMSGHLRATFARPNAPGSPMDSYEQGQDWEETIPASEEVCIRLVSHPADDARRANGWTSRRSFRTRRQTRRRRLSSWRSPTLHSYVATSSITRSNAPLTTSAAPCDATHLQLVIDPIFVDYVELAVVPNRHTAWRLQDDEWKEQIMVP